MVGSVSTSTPTCCLSSSPTSSRHWNFVFHLYGTTPTSYPTTSTATSTTPSKLSPPPVFDRRENILQSASISVQLRNTNPHDRPITREHLSGDNASDSHDQLAGESAFHYCHGGSRPQTPRHAFLSRRQSFSQPTDEPAFSTRRGGSSQIARHGFFLSRSRIFSQPTGRFETS